IANAKCDAQTGGGGGVTNFGTLNVTQVTFSKNDSTNCAGGGGIDNEAGTLTVNNSTFSNNTAGTKGAAISNTGNATISNNSTFTNNETGGDFSGIGGAIANTSTGTLT